MSELTDFQSEVARLFFSLRTSEGFLPAGGGALIAAGLSSRSTRDLDFFGVRGRSSVENVARDFIAEVVRRGWNHSVVESSAEFVRIELRASESLVVDIAHDSPPIDMPVTSAFGPTFAHAELAARKLIALFDRAEARDFVDVYVLAQRFDKGTLVNRASDIDGGLDPVRLAESIHQISRFRDEDLPIDNSKVASLRQFFADWASELSRPL